MIYDLSNPFDLPNFEAAVTRVRERGEVVELTSKRAKSRAQNNYLHLILGHFALETGYTIEEVKYRIFKCEVNKHLFVREKVNKNGEVIRYVCSVNELTKEQMSEAIDRFRNWSVSEADIYLPDADEHRLLVFIERELQRNAMYN